MITPRRRKRTAKPMTKAQKMAKEKAIMAKERKVMAQKKAAKRKKTK